MNLTQSKVDASSKGFQKLQLKAYEGAKPEWRMYAMETTSTGASETYDFLNGLPGMKEMGGEAAIRNISTSGFTIVNKEFEATVGVKVADVERDKLGIYSNEFSEMGSDAAFHPDELCAELLNKGFVNKDYTNKAFFAEDKKLNPEDNSNKARKFTNKGTAALDGPSFSAARTSLRKRTNAEGKNLKLGKKLLLIVPPALEEVANKLMTAEELNGSTNTLRNAAEVLVINELSSDTAWFLIEVGKNVKPLIVQYEVKPMWAQVTNLNDSHVVLKKTFLYQVYDRKNVGYGMPQLAYGSTGAG